MGDGGRKLSMKIPAETVKTMTQEVLEAEEEIA